MKFTVHKLRVGDQVWAQVVEHVSPDEFIVSFHGDLTRVRNESLKKLKLNEKILVRVLTVKPLEFQLVVDVNKKSGATRINITA